ncbi:MAG: TetR/AcrR family transcriptional regulator [Lachnospiraceae bacterium]|nr:TetR/AcrR family transcriptional regulator [Lachnospiraceae bacterium]
MPRVNEEYFEKKRKEILDAAYRVCIKKPITSVTMNDVIAETGFSHGVIYKYYKDLDEVIRDLMIRINKSNLFNDDADKIFEECGTDDWEKAIRRICDLLADNMIKAGIDVLKISLYCNVFAVSEPERAKKIAKRLGEDNLSPLLYVITSLNNYLTKIIKEKKIHPSHSVNDIIQFIIVYYSGVENSYVFSECYNSNDPLNKYDPKKMFSLMADSVILMLKGVD